MPGYYRRQAAPPLPDPSTLPFPGNVVRLCSSCDLRKGCTAPVPGVGPIPARVLLIGEAPGYQEDQWGKPFIGAAGEQLESMLSQSSMPRDLCYIVNTIRCRPPNNRTPVRVELDACAKWLNIELDLGTLVHRHLPILSLASRRQVIVVQVCSEVHRRFDHLVTEAYPMPPLLLTSRDNSRSLSTGSRSPGHHDVS